MRETYYGTCLVLFLHQDVATKTTFHFSCIRMLPLRQRFTFPASGQLLYRSVCAAGFVSAAIKNVPIVGGTVKNQRAGGAEALCQIDLHHNPERRKNTWNRVGKKALFAELFVHMSTRSQTLNLASCRLKQRLWKTCKRKRHSRVSRRNVQDLLCLSMRLCMARMFHQRLQTILSFVIAVWRRNGCCRACRNLVQGGETLSTPLCRLYAWATRRATPTLKYFCEKEKSRPHPLDPLHKEKRSRSFGFWSFVSE